MEFLYFYRFIIRTVATPPPYVIVVVGPPKVGKTTLIRSLIKHYTKQKVVKPIGPITIISGEAYSVLILGTLYLKQYKSFSVF
jgi:GTPase SAR1 family protein